MSVRYRGIRALGLLDPAERASFRRFDRALRDIAAQITRISQRQQSLLQQISADPGLVRFGNFADRPKERLLYINRVSFMLYYAIDTDQLFAWDGLIWTEVGGGGTAGRNLIFFDDFLANVESSPFSGASGTWRSGSSGAGTGLVVDATNFANTRALGVWLFSTGPVVDGAHQAISPANGADFNLSAAVGLRLGCQFRISTADFTRGHFMVGISNMDLSSSAINDGTESLNFGVWNGGTNGYPLNADPETDTLYFRARHSGNDQIVKFGASGDMAGFQNIEISVDAEQTASLYIDGVLRASLGGSAVPPSTQAVALQIRMETRGSSNPAGNQKAYVDRVWLDGSSPLINRGPTFF